MPTGHSNYDRIITHIFERKFTGSSRVDFERDDIISAAAEIQIERPRNLGDVIYSYRFRRDLPESIRNAALPGYVWIIRLVGTARYRFVAVETADILPNSLIGETKIPDATPGLISKYALSDEQALLAKVRYNRLLDIFTGVTTYSLQSHLRTQLVELGQVETDELYVGVDRHGAHYVFPIQAKGGRDRLGIVQIEQDYALCQVKFPDVICRPIGAQFIEADHIALFEFSGGPSGVALIDEKHYRLVRPDALTSEDLAHYRSFIETT